MDLNLLHSFLEKAAKAENIELAHFAQNLLKEAEQIASLPPTGLPGVQQLPQEDSQAHAQPTEEKGQKLPGIEDVLLQRAMPEIEAEEKDNKDRGASPAVDNAKQAEVREITMWDELKKKING